MSESIHELILASAGTGKTYRLSNRFLELLFSGADPQSILATTFTRKAASEILDRVLERLVAAAESDVERGKLNEALRGLEVGREECLALLTRLTRGIDTFQVRTIDSFFVHLTRLFALDLELPPDWRIVSTREQTELAAEAMQDLLVEIDRDELLGLLRALHQGGARRRVHGAMLDTAQSRRPIFRESTPEAWDRIELGRDVSDEELCAAMEALPGAVVPLTKKGEPNGNWEKARQKILLLANEGDWPAILAAGLGKAYLAGDSPEARLFYKQPFSESLDEALAPIVQRARHSWLAELRARNLAMRSLLEHFETALGTLQYQRGSYRFDDLPKALAPRTSAELPLDLRELDMWFRLDGKIDHLLLDEFQDTSPIQWRILEPIAREIAADGTGDRSFFCVGDVKQSIYAFRQAEPRLLAQLDRMLPGLVPEAMDQSYRSSAVVLGAVNRVFLGLEGNAALAADELAPYRRAAATWGAGFREHRTARQDLPGAAFVIEARELCEGETKSLPMLERCLERVERIREEAPQATIGILMRKNRNIPFLIHRLRHQGIDASGEGGGPLTDSEAVRVFLSMLHLADHPDDSAAAFHVGSSAVGEAVGLEREAPDEERHRFARELRARLISEGLGGVAASVAALITPGRGWSGWDVARFTQLLDLAHAFEAEMGLRPSLFVQHLRAERVEAPGRARVRVMTVHASKGLEFDVVILPELEEKLVGRRPELMVDRPRPEGLIHTVTGSPRKELLNAHDELKRLYDATTERSVEDALSNLYVAMTRAARRLELIVSFVDPDLERKPSKSPTAADLIRAALPSEECTRPGDRGILWSHPENASNEEWPVGIGEAKAQSLEPELRELRLAPGGRRRSLPRRSPSAEEGGGAIRARDLFRPRSAARRGTLAHHWLEGLEWIEEWQPDRAVLLATGAKIEPDATVREELFDSLRAALATDEIRTALSRAACEAPAGAELEVRNECAFSIVFPNDDGTEELWTGSIDRLVLARRGERIVWAEILDYKTDDVAGDELTERAGYYRPQLASYARVIAAQTGLKATEIPTRLIFLKPGRVVSYGGSR